VQVDVSSDYQAGGIIHHIGYVISGTTADGVYLVVQDCNKTGTGTYNCNGNDPDYFLDTPTGEGPGGDWDDDAALPGFSTRTFSPATTGNAATLLKDPLWYAATWGGFKDTDRNNRPNLPAEWDGNGNGDPDNYFLVTNALTLSEQLRAAFSEILGRASSASSAAVNSGSISTDTRVYQARFNTENWTGDLFSYRIDARTGALDPIPAWQATANGKIPGPAARNIITVNSNDAAVPFQWVGGIDLTRKAQLDADPVRAEAILDYLRGERSREESRAPGADIQLRDRTTVLGDIVSSAPIFVGAPRGRYSDTLDSEPYSTFVVNQRNRNAMVYVGANDGMLHGFDAGGVSGPDPDGAGPQLPPEDGNGGQELFAFIPKTVFGNLSELSRPNYTHRYYVDGAPNSNDVFINGAWRTVLVGGLNSGGQGIYALDVTNPGSLGTSSLLWEINDRTVDGAGNRPFIDLGYTFSQPAIVRLHDGTWAAVFGNGYNNTVPDGAASATGNAVLYIVDIETGTLLKKFDTFAGLDDAVSGDRPNGLATPTMVDVDGDRIVDHAYVGDLYGNLWKIDLRSTNPDEWGFAFGTAANPEPFFVANDGEASPNRQPITSRVEVTRGPFGAGVMLLIGTGKFLEPDDRLTTPRRVQSFYGLVDRNTYTATDKITGRNLLTRQEITEEFQIPNSTQRGRRTTARETMGSGWYLDLKLPGTPGVYEGERVVADPIIRDDRVIFTTLIPTTDPYPTCNFGGRSWLMVLDLLGGGQLTQTQLDTNGDNVINGDDTNVSGVTSDATGGILSRPAGLRCLGSGCLEDRLISSSTNDGAMDQRALKSIGGARGRQSWRQIR
jgi:type IV pilus assembly protein PilY1